MNAMVSGSTGGIGFAIAEGLAKLGYDLVIHSRNQLQSEKKAKEISLEYNVRCLGVAADLSKKEEVAELFRVLNEKDFLPEVLVNNAGKYYVDSIESQINHIQDAINDNLISTIHLTNVFLPHFKAQNKGNIVNICSIVSREPRKDAVSYSIAKCALDTYTKLLRLSVKDFNVKVTAIFPGSVYTPSWDGLQIEPRKLIPDETISNLVNMILNQADSVELNEIHLKAFNFD